jgi:hypothetical protein
MIFIQPVPEARQDRVIETGITQLKSEEVLPIDSDAHSIRCIPVRKPLGELHDCHQGEAPRCSCRLSSFREERFEERIVEYGSKMIAQLYAGVSARDCGFGCKQRDVRY